MVRRAPYSCDPAAEVRIAVVTSVARLPNTSSLEVRTVALGALRDVPGRSLQHRRVEIA